MTDPTTPGRSAPESLARRVESDGTSVHGFYTRLMSAGYAASEHGTLPIVVLPAEEHERLVAELAAFSEAVAAGLLQQPDAMLDPENGWACSYDVGTISRDARGATPLEAFRAARASTGRD